MIGIGHGGAGDLHTIFDNLFELMKHPISPKGDVW
jgi:hypothetical protein